MYIETVPNPIGGVIGEPRHVIQLVFALAYLHPDAHTDLPILRRPVRLHNLRSITVPSDHRVVDWRVIWRAGFVALGRERHMPHAHDGILITF